MFGTTNAIIEPEHNKANKMICVPNKDSDQPGHPSSLNNLCSKDSQWPKGSSWGQQSLIRWGIHPVWTVLALRIANGPSVLPVSPVKTGQRPRLLQVFTGLTGGFAILSCSYIEAPSTIDVFSVCDWFLPHRITLPYCSGLFYKWAGQISRQLHVQSVK